MDQPEPETDARETYRSAMGEAKAAAALSVMCGREAGSDYLAASETAKVQYLASLVAADNRSDDAAISSIPGSDGLDTIVEYPTSPEMPTITIAPNTPQTQLIPTTTTEPTYQPELIYPPRSNTRDYKLICAIASGSTIKEIEQKLNICRKTILKKLTDPVIQREVDLMRSAYVDRAYGRVLASAEIAADRIVELLHHESGPVSLAAAKTILELARVKEKCQQPSSVVTREITIRETLETYRGAFAEAERLSRVTHSAQGVPPGTPENQ